MITNALYGEAAAWISARFGPPSWENPREPFARWDFVGGWEIYAYRTSGGFADVDIYETEYTGGYRVSPVGTYVGQSEVLFAVCRAIVSRVAVLLLDGAALEFLDPFGIGLWVRGLTDPIRLERDSMIESLALQTIRGSLSIPLFLDAVKHETIYLDS